MADHDIDNYVSYNKDIMLEGRRAEKSNVHTTTYDLWLLLPTLVQNLKRISYKRVESCCTIVSYVEV